MGGVPRGFAIANATIGAAIGLGLQQPLIGLPLVDAAAGRGRMGRSRDPWFLETWPRHLAKPPYLRSVTERAMIDLRPYKQTGAKLSDYLLWAALIAPGIVLNKDGAFQRTLQFRGPDLDSATPSELMGAQLAAQQCAAALRFGLVSSMSKRAVRPRPAIPMRSGRTRSPG